MEVNKDISKIGLKWRCSQHPSFPCDFISLDGDSKARVICFKCIQTNSIPVSNLISMGCVLASKETDIIEYYPPLKDQDLSEKLRQASLKQSLEEMDLYFMKLREEFEREIKAAQLRVNAILIKKEKQKQQVLEGYIRIAEVDKLKQLIVSDKERAEKDLDDFIKDKWNKAEENRKVMLDLINQYETSFPFTFDQLNKITEKIIDSLKSISFFVQPIKQEQEVNLIKSTYSVSHKLEISKIDNSIYQIKQEATFGWGQVFLDPILNPLNKYILQIELEMGPGNSSNFFFAGIAKDEAKDNNDACNQNMCYYDYSNTYGITKYVRGNLMQSERQVTGKHCFEFRIHLDQKLLRVSSLPNYSSVAELDDPDKINPKGDYRFFFSLASQGNMIRILNLSIVDHFDEKM